MGQLSDRLQKEGYCRSVGRISADMVRDLRNEAATHVTRFYELQDRRDDYWHYSEPTGNFVLYRVHNLEKQPENPSIAALFKSEFLADIAAEVLGEDAVQTVCALIVKMAHHGGPVPWHRDRGNMGPGQVVNLSVYLDESHEDNGCVEVLPGSHLWPVGKDIDAERHGHEPSPVMAVPGQVSAHDVRILHWSRQNPSPTTIFRIVAEFRKSSVTLLD